MKTRCMSNDIKTESTSVDRRVLGMRLDLIFKGFSLTAISLRGLGVGLEAAEATYWLRCKMFSRPSRTIWYSTFLDLATRAVKTGKPA
jgi:hypothetical protein